MSGLLGTTCLTVRKIMFDEERVRKFYTDLEVVATLQRLAELVEQEIPVEIQIAGERICVPPYASVAFEYEQGKKKEVVEIKIKWRRK
jgi:amphi-Trp domain-containing protein